MLSYVAKCILSQIELFALPRLPASYDIAPVWIYALGTFYSTLILLEFIARTTNVNIILLSQYVSYGTTFLPVQVIAICLKHVKYITWHYWTVVAYKVIFTIG